VGLLGGIVRCAGETPTYSSRVPKRPRAVKQYERRRSRYAQLLGQTMEDLRAESGRFPLAREDAAPQLDNDRGSFRHELGYPASNALGVGAFEQPLTSGGPGILPGGLAA